ncbi:hypothetical protein WN51_04850 [Melipona quadrifasciata]|uniref:Uncharacterized protein n=1 Tax=Melipona quadrifasciata TaxID=166423 RepID=A0A0M8ZS99_9HYME|nr:hypothetical protein WN51_04850 [Melipona quadrifasciata]
MVDRTTFFSFARWQNKRERTRPISAPKIDPKRDKKQPLDVQLVEFSTNLVSRDKFESSPPVDRATDSEWIRIVMPELARWR